MDGEIFMFIPILFFIVFAVIIAPILGAVQQKKKQQQQPRRKPQQQQQKGYNREVDAIHRTTDASTERRHRLDQLKSLYEAGMMERDEYNDRAQSIENDYLGMR